MYAEIYWCITKIYQLGIVSSFSINVNLIKNVKFILRVFFVIMKKKYDSQHISIHIYISVTLKNIDQAHSTFLLILEHGQ